MLCKNSTFLWTLKHSVNMHFCLHLHWCKNVQYRCYAAAVVFKGLSMHSAARLEISQKMCHVKNSLEKKKVDVFSQRSQWVCACVNDQNLKSASMLSHLCRCCLVAQGCASQEWHWAKGQIQASTGLHIWLQHHLTSHLQPHTPPVPRNQLAVFVWTDCCQSRTCQMLD